jgi:hypothetical protein
MEIPAEFQHGCRLTNVQVPRLEQRQHSREPTDLDTAETPLTKVSNRNACRIGSKLNRGSLNNLKRGATSFREHQVIPGRLLRSEEIMPIPEVRSTPEPRTAMPHEREDTRHGNCLQRFEAAFSERIKQAEHRGWRVEADVARWLRQRWPRNPQPSQLRHVILHNTYYGRKGGLAARRLMDMHETARRRQSMNSAGKCFAWHLWLFKVFFLYAERTVRPPHPR